MTVTITVTSNGPFVLEADDSSRVAITDVRGNAQSPVAQPVALCRCGHSASKPYCDGTHSTIGFTDGE